MSGATDLAAPPSHAHLVQVHQRQINPITSSLHAPEIWTSGSLLGFTPWKVLRYPTQNSRTEHLHHPHPHLHPPTQAMAPACTQAPAKRRACFCPTHKVHSFLTLRVPAPAPTPLPWP